MEQPRAVRPADLLNSAVMSVIDFKIKIDTTHLLKVKYYETFYRNNYSAKEN